MAAPAGFLSMTHMTWLESSKLTSVVCLSLALLLSKSHEGAQKQTDIQEGQDRNCDGEPPLYQEGLQHGETESFLISQNGVLGRWTISIPPTHASPLFELPWRHLAHITPLFKQCRTQNVWTGHMQPWGHFTVTKNRYEIRWSAAITLC